MTAPRFQPLAWPRIPPESWREQAACLHHPTLPPQTWDDSLTEDSGRETHRNKRIQAAIAVCKTCPVRIPCLDDADLSCDDGIRGGVDLRRLREERRVKLATLPGASIDHGTERGAKQHYRRGESACPSCAAAANRAKAEREAARPAKVPCHVCHKLITRTEISRHRRRMHGGGE